MIIQNKEEEFKKAIQAIYSWPHGQLNIQKMDLFAHKLPIDIVMYIIDEFLVCFMRHLNGYIKKLKELEEKQKRYSNQIDDVTNFDKTSWIDDVSEFMEYRGVFVCEKEFKQKYDVKTKQYS